MPTRSFHCGYLQRADAWIVLTVSEVGLFLCVCMFFVDSETKVLLMQDESILLRLNKGGKLPMATDVPLVFEVRKPPRKRNCAEQIHAIEGSSLIILFLKSTWILVLGP